MRVLLDEMMSSKLARELEGHQVSTVSREGWTGLTNGTLLDVIAARFDVFITMDKGMRHQQRLRGRAFGVIEVRAPSNAIRDLLPVVARLQAAISTIQPGELVTIATASESGPLPDPDDAPSREDGPR